MKKKMRMREHYVKSKGRKKKDKEKLEDERANYI